MLDKEQFKDNIIIPTLQHLSPIIPYSEAAVELLLGTAMVESQLTYVRQLGRGPALGVYQMEPATHDDIWENYISHRYHLEDDLCALFISDSAEDMVGNLNYATAMARIHYYRVSEALPEAGDLEGMAKYWKKYYNTPEGKGQELKYVIINKPVMFNLKGSV